jgi:hypothetical protein
MTVTDPLAQLVEQVLRAQGRQGAGFHGLVNTVYPYSNRLSSRTGQSVRGKWKIRLTDSVTRLSLKTA